jgi:hypothetical protein
MPAPNGFSGGAPAATSSEGDDDCSPSKLFSVRENR